ncbi:polyprenyl synthetase family protein [Kiritimatiella glycovorans]|uniref:Octaprenyl-diphosphate synthase n=1 Tax=Kiritimatiella glycovorans TaxID=1307763 RepID=A0A0G3EI64_9BACT|nr:polyprenyl synthetase family protein [Kiritimatiella glycovorans]AKJ63824.1 Octaprenyl-diphosphate synthase [Kiritimatiella glycovorans]
MPDLKEVDAAIAEALEGGELDALIREAGGLVSGGKRLRAKLVLALGPATGVEPEVQRRAAAAVELVHAASLLHDDVIDGGRIRRGAPSFWTGYGVNGAVLLGDWLVFRALSLLRPVSNGRLAGLMIGFGTEVCEAEAAQELVFRGGTGRWERSLDFARRKTGALFAFAAEACGGCNRELSGALRESGYRLGTAYQVADDVLDEHGDREEADKSLGSDRSRGKVTAVTVEGAPDDPAAFISDLLDASAAPLHKWREISAAWSGYVDATIRPLVDRYLNTAG